MHGRGKFTYNNGTVYEGEMRNDEMNGRGKCTFADGGVYVGEFAEGKKVWHQSSLMTDVFACQM
jgi:hypothetical protein